MDLEQSIHHAKSIEVTVTQGETTRWTSFIVEAEGNRLEFTAFGDLPIRYTYLENETVEDVAGEFAALRSVVQVHDSKELKFELVELRSDHRDVVKMSEFRLDRARKAESACAELRAELEDMRDQLAGFQIANNKLADNVEEWADRNKMQEDQLADVNQELASFRNEQAARGEA